MSETEHYRKLVNIFGADPVIRGVGIIKLGSTKHGPDSERKTLPEFVGIPVGIIAVPAPDKIPVVAIFKAILYGQITVQEFLGLNGHDQR